MKEVTLSFGDEGRLVGTLNVASSHHQTFAVVLMSAGFASRVGPHRLNVRLARALARLGVSSLRFDFSGIGESHRPRASIPEKRLRCDELRSAMDCLGEATGASRFVLLAMCSSTDHCIDVAIEDARVVGLALLDPFSYGNTKSQWLNFCRRVAASWRRDRFLSSLRRLLTPPSDLSAKVAIDRAMWDELRPKPTRAEFAAQLRAIAASGRPLQIFYSDYASERHNYDGQFRDAHPELRAFSNIEVVWMQGADHTYSSIAMQEKMWRHVVDWLRVRQALAPIA